MVYLDEVDANEFNSIHYYLAQIAAEVRRLCVGSQYKQGVRLEQFLLRFQRKNVEQTVKSVAERTAQMKAVFFGITGYHRKKDGHNGRHGLRNTGLSPGIRQ